MRSLSLMPILTVASLSCLACAPPFTTFAERHPKEHDLYEDQGWKLWSRVYNENVTLHCILSYRSSAESGEAKGMSILVENERQLFSHGSILIGVEPLRYPMDRKRAVALVDLGAGFTRGIEFELYRNDRAHAQLGKEAVAGVESALLSGREMSVTFDNGTTLRFPAPSPE